MKSCIYLWQYLAEFFFEWEIFQTKIVEKIKTHFVLEAFLRKSCNLWYNMEKYRTARQDTGGNIIRCWKDSIFLPYKEGKNTDTRS